MRQKQLLTCDSKMTPNSANRLPTILKNNKALTDSCPSMDTVEDTASAGRGQSDSPDLPSERKKPQKKVSFRLSELRRQSLTGSLPDLNKASKKDVDASSANLKQELLIERGPLPEGSMAFRAVMDELDTDTESDSGDSATPELRRSWNDGDTGSVGKKLYSSRGQTFQSKAAAAIYSKVYAPSLQKSRNKCASVGGLSKTTDIQDRGTPDDDKSDVGKSSKKDCRANCRHLSPGTVSKKDRLSPASCDRHSKNSTKRSPSPSRRFSSLVSSKMTEISGTTEKITIRRNVAEVRRLQKS